MKALLAPLMAPLQGPWQALGADAWSAEAIGAVVAGFVAVVLVLEGLVLLWWHTRSAAARRLQHRLQAWLPALAPNATDASGGAKRSAGASGRGEPGRSVTSRFTRWLKNAWERGAPHLGFKTQRQRAVERQLPDALDLMSRSLRAGHALPAALQFVGTETPAPVGEAFARLHEQLGYGRPLDTALQDLTERLPGEDVRFFVTALRVQRQTGGNLAEVLDRLAHLMRQRLRLADRLRVLLAEGRLSAQVLTAMPLLTAAALYAIKPDFMRVLWTDPVGIALLKATLVLYAIGLVWMWRLTRLEV